MHFLMYINLIYRFQIYVIKNLPKFCRFEQIRLALLVISTSLNERKKSRLLSVVEAIRVAITFDGRKVLWYIEKEETPKLIWSSPLGLAIAAQVEGLGGCFFTLYLYLSGRKEQR